MGDGKSGVAGSSKEVVEAKDEDRAVHDDPLDSPLNGSTEISWTC